ncbi:MAG: stage III sporulation protein AE [Clostridia bacterium]|nr:stage III sporulation protein AE [Clostridia bacterium]
MKRVVTILFFSVLLFFVSTDHAMAENKSKEEIEAELGAEVERYVDSLDLSEFESYLSSLDAPSSLSEQGIRGLIKDFVKGEIPLDVGGILSYLGQTALGALRGTLASLITVMIIAVMSSVLSGLTSGFVHKQTIEIVHYVFYALIVSLVMVKVGGIVKECRAFCEGVERTSESVFPPLITLMSALGGAVSSSVYKPQVAFFTAILSKVFGSVILPLFIASIAFCLIGNLSSQIKMDKIQSAIRYCSTLIVSAVFGLFMTYLTIAGITGGMVDGVGIKAAKFVLSGYVPILGGYLSQGFDLISAGCVLIKNSIGMIGILCVIFVIAKPILHVTIYSFALKIVASFVQPIGDKRISDLLYSVSNATKILVTSILGSGFVMILTLLLMIVSCNVGVL